MVRLNIFWLVISILCCYTTYAQREFKITNVEDVVQGGYTYPAGNAKLNYYVAQKKVGSYLQLFKIASGQEVQITFDSADHSHPAFSSSGLQLAYTMELNGRRDIYLLDTENNTHSNLTNTPAFSESHPSWSQHDSLIVFNTDRFDSLQEIGCINVFSRQVTRLTTNYEEHTYGSLSPNGKRLLYSKWLDAQKNPEIYILSLTENTEIRLTDNTVRDVAPVWLTDSTISYSQSGSIVIYNLQTRTQTRLISSTEFMYGRGIPFDRTRLLCERSRDRRPEGLSLIHIQDFH